MHRTPPSILGKLSAYSYMRRAIVFWSQMVIYNWSIFFTDAGAAAGADPFWRPAQRFRDTTPVPLEADVVRGGEPL